MKMLATSNVTSANLPTGVNGQLELAIGNHNIVFQKCSSLDEDSTKYIYVLRGIGSSRPHKLDTLKPASHWD